MRKGEEGMGEEEKRRTQVSRCQWRFEVGSSFGACGAA
jgi:hypothetical protein